MEGGCTAEPINLMFPTCRLKCRLSHGVPVYLVSSHRFPKWTRTATEKPL